MKILLGIALIITSMAAGFAAGVPVGRSEGFSTGSEWAIVQAEILAREAGMFMPVHFEDGMFRITFKQPRGLHKRAWKLADRHHDEMTKGASCERPLSQTAQLTRSAYITQ
jgi:hypothetical protein